MISRKYLPQVRPIVRRISRKYLPQVRLAKGQPLVQAAKARRHSEFSILRRASPVLRLRPRWLKRPGEIIGQVGAQVEPHTKPPAGRILVCVKKHFTALREPCKEAIGRAAERKVRAR